MTGRFGELLLILLIILVLFGAGKIPKIMADIGRGVRALKKSAEEDRDADKKDNKE
jgi:sec-independent protein translocase protein TatA